MKKILTWTLSLLALWAIFQTQPVRAEDENQRLCRLAAEEVRQTGAIMERAAPVIRECANDSARMLFARALRAQAAAREALGNHNCRAALRLTAQARRLTFAALRLCGDHSGDGAAPVPEDYGEMMKD